MYEQQLIIAGLSLEEARAYEALVRYGSLQAGDLARKANLSSRTLAYKILNQLADRGLAEKKEEEKKVARYFPAHPIKLREYIDKKKESAEHAVAAIEAILGKLTSDFNLISGKPGVRFFEGKSGMKAILDDSLTARGEIYSYADIESIQKYIPDINTEYVKQREKFHITKKAILLDTPFARKFLTDYHRDVTDLKLITYDAPPFQTVMQIYDNKVSYLTLGSENMIGAVIEDPHVYTMHKYLFEYIWRITPLFSQIPPIEKNLSPNPQFEDLA